MTRLPRAGLLCALVAFANALVWAYVTPPFQVPDEGAHIAYVQYLAERGDVPDDPDKPAFSREEAMLYGQLRVNSVIGVPANGTIWSDLQQRELRAAIRNHPSRIGGGSVGNSGQPPLYYALEAGVYRASPWQDLLSRMALMRLLSCVMTAFTVLMIFMFLREVFVSPWIWTAGALVVAFQPMFGFISSGVNADALSFAASAALFFTLARAFRRGLTPRLGLAIGATLAVGALAKFNFLALIPGALLGLALLLWRRRRADWRPALAGAGVAVGVLAAAVAAVVAINVLVWGRGAWGSEVAAAAQSAAGGTPGGGPALNLREQIAYTWQLYLPRLPFMIDQFNYSPQWNVWFQGTIGRFGWVDTNFPEWVYRLAAGLVVPVVALFVAGVVRLFSRWRGRLAELATYAAIVVGVLLSIGVQGSRYRLQTGMAFEQARYLAPMLALYAAAIVVAARGAGRRFERPVGALLVVLAMAHNLFAMLLVVSRYYA